MTQHPFLPDPPRHDRLFELMRQRSAARRPHNKAESDELELAEMHKFMVEAGESLAPRRRFSDFFRFRL